MKITRAFLSTILFLVLLGLIYYFHIIFFRVNVVFYAAIKDTFLATLIAGIFLFFLDYFSVLGKFERVQLVIIWLLLGYGFAISIPTVIDRSLSFYILEKLQQRGGGIKLDAFEKVFTQEYVKEHHLVEVRLTEQQESGTIIIDKGCVKLTNKGDQLAHFSRFFRQNFLPKKRLLMGSYSDALVDPFRNSSVDPDYICK
jgi:hypothetical protein